MSIGKSGKGMPHVTNSRIKGKIGTFGMPHVTDVRNTEALGTPTCHLFGYYRSIRDANMLPICAYRSIGTPTCHQFA